MVVWLDLLDFRCEVSIPRLRLKLKELVEVIVHKRLNLMTKKRQFAEAMALKFEILVDTDLYSGNLWLTF